MIGARLGKLTLAALAAIALAACATAPPETGPTEPHAPPAPHVPPSRRDTMLELAASMLGQPYRFGGDAPGGFDCSGLVAYAASGAGIRVPRTALEQFGAGTPVAKTRRRTIWRRA